MAPNAVAKAAAVKGVVGGEGDLVVIKTNVHPHQMASNSNDPICFEYTNTGVCGRLQRGEQCRYRHLENTHPDVVGDRVRQGKLPPIALEYAQRGDVAALQNIFAGRDPSGQGPGAMGAGMPGMPMAAQASQSLPKVVFLLPKPASRQACDSGATS